MPVKNAIVRDAILLTGGVERRFWEKVRKGPSCWTWMGAQRGNGYGVMKVSGRLLASHRLAWMLSNQSDIPAGIYVCHRCDNRQCVRPGHLFLGTPKDNATDTIVKGRANRSTGPRLARKLSEGEILEIRNLAEAGVSHRALSRQFNVTPTHVGNVVSRKSWGDVR